MTDTNLPTQKNFENAGSVFEFLPGSPEEVKRFKEIQAGFARQYQEIFPDTNAARTVVIVPSLTLDQEILSKVKGHFFYEERMLCLLMLLRMPRTHVVFVTSVPIDPVIIDYYLHLLPGITGFHARQRLTLLSCYDSSPLSLTEKILDRPLLMERIKKAIPPNHSAHIAPFIVTAHERTLSVKLGVPIFGCDPELYGWGTKSKCRELFKDCGLLLPDGFENLHSEEEVIESLFVLKKRYPQLRKAVVKMNDGFSGEGNAIFSFKDAPEDNLRQWIADNIAAFTSIVAGDMNYKTFMNKFQEMGGIVECFIDAPIKTSPSVQCRINPVGEPEISSTHDQLLGGESGQVFLGASFPADPVYNKEIGAIGKTVARYLKERGVLGRFSVDFLSTKVDGKWQHYAIEINLRKGGTTHPYLMLQFLTDGYYQPDTGEYVTASGQPRYYFATDNLYNEKYHGLAPMDLVDMAICNGLHYDASSQEGVTFHLIGALSQFGKLGVVCIGKDRGTCDRYYQKVIKVLENSGKTVSVTR
jgi:hypothetical protein